MADWAGGRPAAEWESDFKTQVDLFFGEALALQPAKRDNSKDAFLVQQGNVYVTLALTRFVLLSVSPPPPSFASSLVLADERGGRAAQAIPR